MPEVYSGRILLVSTTPPLEFGAYMQETPPNLQDGNAIWNKVARPRRTSFTQWMGTNPLEMVIPCLVDNFIAGGSVEAALSSLERMRLPIAAFKQPPTVTVYGNVPHKSMKWVIEGIEWGESLQNGFGERSRQYLTITLLQYVDDDRVPDLNAAKNASDTARSKSVSGFPRTYIVKNGDTLTSIAVVAYGDAAKWREIADANGIRDPSNIRQGQKIILP